MFVAVRYFSYNGKDYVVSGYPEVFTTLNRAVNYAKGWADKYGKETIEEKETHDFAYSVSWRTESDTWLRIVVYGRNLNANY